MKEESNRESHAIGPQTHRKLHHDQTMFGAARHDSIRDKCSPAGSNVGERSRGLCTTDHPSVKKRNRRRRHQTTHHTCHCKRVAVRELPNLPKSRQTPFIWLACRKVHRLLSTSLGVALRMPFEKPNSGRHKIAAHPHRASGAIVKTSRVLLTRSTCRFVNRSYVTGGTYHEN